MVLRKISLSASDDPPTNHSRHVAELPAPPPLPSPTVRRQESRNSLRFQPLPTLYVAIYRPGEGSLYDRWALYVQDGPEHLVFWSPRHFVHHIEATDPSESESLLELLFVAVLDRDGPAKVRHIAETTLIDNTTPGWDLRDYVLAVLGRLVKHKVVNEDERYIEARNALLDNKMPDLG